MGVRTANVQDGNIGETLTDLAEVIHGRRDASPQESYTARLLTDVEDELLKMVPPQAPEGDGGAGDGDLGHRPVHSRQVASASPMVSRCCWRTFTRRCSHRATRDNFLHFVADGFSFRTHDDLNCLLIQLNDTRCS